jgi:hypothetical protein
MKRKFINSDNHKSHRKKEVEDYDKKVKTVMVNNSTNINRHSLNTKTGVTPSDVGNAGDGLSQNK